MPVPRCLQHLQLQPPGDRPGRHPAAWLSCSEQGRPIPAVLLAHGGDSQGPALRPYTSAMLPCWPGRKKARNRFMGGTLPAPLLLAQEGTWEPCFQQRPMLVDLPAREARQGSRSPGEQSEHSSSAAGCSRRTLEQAWQPQRPTPPLQSTSQLCWGQVMGQGRLALSSWKPWGSSSSTPWMHCSWTTPHMPMNPAKQEVLQLPWAHSQVLLLCQKKASPEI